MHTQKIMIIIIIIPRNYRHSFGWWSIGSTEEEMRKIEEGTQESRKNTEKIVYQQKHENKLYQ